MKSNLYIALLCIATLSACGGGGGGGGGGAPTTGGGSTEFNTRCPDGTRIAGPPSACPSTNPIAQPPANPNPPAQPPASPPDYTESTATDNYFMPGGTFDPILSPANQFYFNNRGIGVACSGSWNIAHRIILGNCGQGAQTPPLRLNPPPLPVRQAWADGWTGQGVNIMVADNFGVAGVAPIEANTHGFQVFAAANQVAPRANYYGANATGDTGLDPLQGGLFNLRTNAQLTDPTVLFGVVNLSSGEDPMPVVTQADIDQWLAADAAAVANIPAYADLSRRSQDAVVVKAAGNEDGTDAAHFLDHQIYLRGLNPHTDLDQILFVGALDKWGEDSNPALAGYSNIAGDTAAMRNRFLVEYGGTAFWRDPNGGSDRIICDGPGPASVHICNNRQEIDTTANAVGTSFAVPRVAGYAALVRHKFPNLTGAQTASLLLDTATLNGLSGCAGGDDAPNVEATCERRYGQGRVDIGAALSPVGALE